MGLRLGSGLALGFAEVVAHLVRARAWVRVRVRVRARARVRIRVRVVAHLVRVRT